VVRDFPVDDAWASASVHEEIQLLKIANYSFGNEQVPSVETDRESDRTLGGRVLFLRYRLSGPSRRLHELRLCGRESQIPNHELAELVTLPPRLHNTRIGMAVRAKQQVSDFVGDGAAQDYWSLEFGIVTLGPARRIFVVHTGQNWMDGETEDG